MWIEMNNNRNKIHHKVIKYKGRVKNQNDNLKINPDFCEPAILLKEYDVKYDGIFQNKNDSLKIKNNQSTTINHFTNNKELDARIKHKKQRIGD